MPDTPVFAADLLVVDDDPAIRQLLARYLESGGYGVRTAADGPTAIRMAHERVPDLVLLDVMMPGMTGLEVCMALKRHPLTRLTQVMLVTALGDPQSRVAGLDTGADDFIAKPVHRDEFLARTRALLRARRLLVELDEARSALARRSEELQLKKTLAQSLIHDLKNPIAGLLANLELLMLTTGDGAARTIERCRQTALRMRRMALDLLDVEALEEGRLRPRREALDPAALMERVAAEGRAAAGAVRIKVEAEPGAGTLAGDPELLARVLENLVQNAVHHSPSGSTVTLAARRSPAGIELSVTDQGPGVPVELREQVFEKAAHITLREKGLSLNRGLGLSFCRLAVEAQGGSIRIEDGEGSGARFRVVLPAAEALTASPPPAPALAEVS